MKLEIVARDFELSNSLRSYIEKRINFALSARFDQIKRIEVSVADSKGLRGGNYKHCQVRVVLPRLQDVVVEDMHSNMYDAIDQAVDRSRNKVSQNLAERFTKLQQTITTEFDSKVA